MVKTGLLKELNGKYILIEYYNIMVTVVFIRIKLHTSIKM